MLLKSVPSLVMTTIARRGLSRARRPLTVSDTRVLKHHAAARLREDPVHGLRHLGDARRVVHQNRRPVRHAEKRDVGRVVLCHPRDERRSALRMSF